MGLPCDVRMMSTLALLVVLFATIDEGAIVGHRSPRVRRYPPISRGSRAFSSGELQCLMDDKVLHPDGNCYALRHTGPCSDREWLVLDKDNAPLAAGEGRRRLVCAPVPCNGALGVFWPEDGQCHSPTDKEVLCPYGGNKLRSDSYGEGECACQRGSARFKPDILKRRNTIEELDGMCYPLFHRGPCPKAMILFPEILEGFGVVGKCFDDFCPMENFRDPNPPFVRDINDGECYQLGTRGPCPPEDTYTVDAVTYKPECVNPVSSVFGSGHNPCGGPYDKLGMECKEKVDFRINSMAFVYDVRGLKYLRRTNLSPRLGEETETK